jgi:hypothetical protein
VVTQQLRNGLCVMFERLKMQEYTKYKRDDSLERQLKAMLADLLMLATKYKHTASHSETVNSCQILANQRF